MNYVITLGHVPSRIWKLSCEKFYEMHDRNLEIKHLFLNQHYALNKNQNEIENKKICDEYGIEWIDAGKNLGLHNGFNYVMKQKKMTNGDFVLGYDPDSCPISPGFDMALRSCFLDSNVAWSSLMAPWLSGLLVGSERKISAFNVTEITQPIMNSICMWRVSWLNEVGGLSEPYEMYGGLECHMWPKLNGNKWVFLKDFFEDHSYHWLQDEEYKRWKWYLCHERKLDYTFEEYVLRGCPIL